MIAVPNVARPARILIVDDERHNRQLIEIMLGPEDLLLQMASSGEEALALVAQQPPDLIVLDIMMPGMDGYDVVTSIKGNAATKNIPVVIVTALDDRNARLRGLTAGAEDFLTKPVDRVELRVRVRNLLQRKRAEEALGQVRDEQLRFKDEFLSHVSHELRSPLTAIKQFTSILLGGLAGELNKEQREYQQIVLKNIHQLQAMIDDLLEVTRLETGKLTIVPTSTSVASAITDTFETLQGAATLKEISLAHDMPPGLPPAFADQMRLRQILIILIDNAIKFTPHGGAILVRVQLLPRNPPFLLIEVSDTGCGIAPEMSENVFERLYQPATPIESSRKGLGLGLYICKELVTRQGGEIWVMPPSQPGATIALTLPVFSLGDLLAPLLKDERWPAESVALVTARTCVEGGWPSRESEEQWSQSVRNVLQRCLLPDLDVLLPDPGDKANCDRFVIAAFADAKGTDILVNRIRGQFARLRQPTGVQLSTTVSCRLVEPFPHEAGSTPASMVAAMARLLENSMSNSPSTGGPQ